MKIVLTNTIDSIDNYELVETETPRPAPGQVLIKVHACSIGYVDSLLALGGYQVKPPLPHTPGQDISGIVESVGEGVESFRKGDRVFALASKGFAEFAVAPEQLVFPLTDSLSFEQGACLPLNYLTSLHALKGRGQLKHGETVLVFGAAGGVGSSAIQVAKAMGATVIAAASSKEKRDFAAGLGADATIDTTPEGWRERLKAIGKPDIVFDPLCGPLFEAAFRSLAWNGRHLVIGFVGGDIPALPVNLPLMKGASLVGVDVRQYMLYELDNVQTDFRDLVSWSEQGLLQPAVGPRFAFEDFRDALKMALSGRVLGKTVLQVT